MSPVTSGSPELSVTDGEPQSPLFDVVVSARKSPVGKLSVKSSGLNVAGWPGLFGFDTLNVSWLVPPTGTLVGLNDLVSVAVGKESVQPHPSGLMLDTNVRVNDWISPLAAVSWNDPQRPATFVALLFSHPPLGPPASVVSIVLPDTVITLFLASVVMPIDPAGRARAPDRGLDQVHVDEVDNRVDHRSVERDRVLLRLPSERGQHVGGGASRWRRLQELVDVGGSPGRRVDGAFRRLIDNPRTAREAGGQRGRDTGRPERERLRDGRATDGLLPRRSDRCHPLLRGGGLRGGRRRGEDSADGGEQQGRGRCAQGREPTPCSFMRTLDRVRPASGRHASPL